MSICEVKDLKKEYIQGDITIPALRGVSFFLEEGEFTAIVGPSGSGKSTLLNCLGALDSPTSGQVIVEGQDLSLLKKNELSDFRLFKIGFVFQAYNLIPVLTALENVEYILLMQGVSKSERQERAMKLFSEMHIQELAQRFPRELSGGQQQRVAVARALVSEPRIILADEPTANLDSVSSGMLLDIMSDMSRKKKVTFLFSTHDSRVMKRASRLISLLDGQIESS
jgi:putative ABC transport system ATP-binding protein